MFPVVVVSANAQVKETVRRVLAGSRYMATFLETVSEAIEFLASATGKAGALVVDRDVIEDSCSEHQGRVRDAHCNCPVLVVASDGPPAESLKPETGVIYMSQSDLDSRLVPNLSTLMAAEGAAAHDGVEQIGYFKGGSWTQQVAPFLDAVARSDVPVLIQGETGVGKEVLARQIHARSARAGRPFVKVNCAALPSELIESELFGYERGAFTGAFQSTPGKFALADQGVLLLDEVGDMDVRLQAKLLQVLQDNQFYRLGARESTIVDVRVIAATHCDLEAAIVENRFREDLFYRLNVANVRIPALRERRDEIIPLAEHFLWKHSGGAPDRPAIGADLRDALLAHSWPGNVRELENIMRKYLVMPRAELLIGDLRRSAEGRRRAAHPVPETTRAVETGASAEPDSPVVPAAGEAASATAAPTMAQVEEFKRAAEVDAIRAALDATQWHRRSAADLLQIDYNVLLYRMKRLGIGRRPPARESSGSVT